MARGPAAWPLSRGLAVWLGGWSGLAFAVIGAFLVLGAGVTIRAELRLRYESRESARWTPVPATIQRSVVSRGGTSRSPVYAPNIGYWYAVDGQRRHGTRVLITSGYSEVSARELVARFRPGDVVTAWVDPGAPGEAVLVRESWHDWLSVAGNTLLFGVGGGLLFVGATVVAYHVDAARRRRAEIANRADAAEPTREGRERAFVRRRGRLRRHLALGAAGFALQGPVALALGSCSGWLAAATVLLAAGAVGYAYATLRDESAGAAVAPRRWLPARAPYRAPQRPVDVAQPSRDRPSAALGLFGARAGVYLWFIGRFAVDPPSPGVFEFALVVGAFETAVVLAVFAARAYVPSVARAARALRTPSEE